MATPSPAAALRTLSSSNFAGGSLMSTDAHMPSRAVAGAVESVFLREQIRQQLPPIQPRSAASTRREDTSDELPSNERSNETAASLCRANGGKKRKTTYYMRKDEMTQLQEEAVVLQATLANTAHGHSQPQGEQAHSLVGALAVNAGLQGRVRLCDLTIASAQSLIASYGSQCRSSPIGGFIHLPRDPIVRQQTLTSMKMPRMREAIAYALTRSRYLNTAKFTKQVDSYETDAGDFVATHWEITPLPEARSVHDTYRELVYFAETQEISMSEKLGILTIRESESDPVDGTQAVRMLSKHGSGVQSETNLAVFTHYFDESELLKQPHALLVADFIDQDDLYPQQPQTRIHKDVASLSMITEVPSTCHGGRPVVTMVRWAFVRVNNNAYTNRSELEEVAREGVGKWCDVMLKSVRDRLAWHS